MKVNKLNKISLTFLARRPEETKSLSFKMKKR